MAIYEIKTVVKQKNCNEGYLCLAYTYIQFLCIWMPKSVNPFSFCKWSRTMIFEINIANDKLFVQTCLLGRYRAVSSAHKGIRDRCQTPLLFNILSCMSRSYLNKETVLFCRQLLLMAFDILVMYFLRRMLLLVSYYYDVTIKIHTFCLVTYFVFVPCHFCINNIHSVFVTDTALTCLEGGLVLSLARKLLCR